MSPPLQSPPSPPVLPSMSQQQPPPPSSSSAAVNTAQLGNMITSVLANHDALRDENEQLRRDLQDALRRAKNAESLAAAAHSPASTALADVQARLDHEQAAHADTRAHLRAVQDAWQDLDRYAGLLDVRAADARSAFAALLRDPAAASASAAHRLPPLRAPSPFAPPRHHHHHHHNPHHSAHPGAIHLPAPVAAAPSSSSASLAPRALQNYPTMPVLPPAPSALPTRRHRADSVEDRPAKRPRPDDAHTMTELTRPPPYYSTPDRYLHPSYAMYPSRAPPRGRSPTRRSPSHAHTHTHTHTLPLHPAHASSSRSRSRSRSRSLSVDHMLLDAAGESPPQPGATATAYQTHVFAPPVTGPPRKRVNAGAAAPTGATGLDKNGGGGTTLIEPYNAASHARIASTAAAAGLPAGGFPPTNEKGQRICRQCGLAGRYKDGKCVEKWGPGPEGPGTVCDRCRKKMKRVERRGTVETGVLAHAAHTHQQSQQSQQHVAAPPSPPQASALGGAHTLPVRTPLAHPPIAALRSPPSPSRSPSLSPSHGSNSGYNAATTNGNGNKYSPPPPSAPRAFASAGGRSPYSYAPAAQNGNGKQTPLSDRDAEGEVEDSASRRSGGEDERSERDDEDDDADVDDDLLEAVDAAEESRSSVASSAHGSAHTHHGGMPVHQLVHGAGGGGGGGFGIGGVKREIVDVLV